MKLENQTLLEKGQSVLLPLLFLLVAFLGANRLQAQDLPEIDASDSVAQILDSLYIAEVQDSKQKDKVLHAEPLYIDLIRDLGARKGEKEWNIGGGITDLQHYDKYSFLVEYEFAPIDRLGLEIEVPLTFYFNHYNQNGQDLNTPARPANRIEGLKLAAQWSFWVSEKNKTTLALGYINELELYDLPKLSLQRNFQGNLFNPFLVAAKRWGTNFHTLLYTGGRFVRHFKPDAEGKIWDSAFENNLSLHYMISGTRNFIGLEINQLRERQGWHTVLRPQMRVSLADNLMIGIVGGIPLNRQHERLSSFVRIIYEPSHKHIIHLSAVRMKKRIMH
jgi:hypothetical protein